MRTDVAYQVIDNRDISHPSGPSDRLLGPIGILTSLPGMIRVSTIDGSEFTWEVPDDDESLEDDEMNRTVVMHTSDGAVTLLELTLANFERLRPSLPRGAPVFGSDDAVNTYYGDLLRSGIA